MRHLSERQDIELDMADGKIHTDELAEFIDGQEYVGLWLAVIQLCVQDIKTYKRLLARNGKDYKNRVRNNCNSALSFIKSDVFDTYCSICQIDADRFRALTNKLI